MCNGSATTTPAPEAPAAASSCCSHDAAAVTTAPAEQATCPVMAGTPVVKANAEAAGLFRDYNGTRYWFCCPACGPLFDADPEKYAAAA
ncbi:YHS domain-containing protein [Nocardioides sp. Bht2]|uniref:YHS domain-containing protein n=1 Tax=Nocardioides sp. Bht2 TaxID=3392297 RepID=UPI0039B6C1C3